MSETKAELVQVARNSQRAVPIVYCAQCRSEVAPDAVFCYRCGTSIVRCSQCNSPRIGDATFCQKCGSVFSTLPMVVSATAPPSGKQTSIPEKANPLFAQMTQMFGLHPIVTFATFAIS